MPFDPDQYAQPVSPESQDNQQPSAGGFDPDAYLNSPAQEEQHQNAGPTVGDYAYGIPKTAWDYVGHPVYEAGKYAIQHPLSTAEAAVGASYIPGVNKLPIISDIKSAREAMLNRYSPGPQATGPSPLAEGPVAPPSNAPGVKIPINQPATSNILGPNGEPMLRTPAPTVSAAPTEMNPAMRSASQGINNMVRGGQVAPEATGSASNYMSRMADLAKTYGDKTLQAARSGAENFADAVMPTLRAVAPYAKPLSVGAVAGLTPGNVGQNYPWPSKGKLAGSEINPASGRPWTPREIQAYEAQFK